MQFQVNKRLIQPVFVPTEVSLLFTDEFEVHCVLEFIEAGRKAGVWASQTSAVTTLKEALNAVLSINK